MKRWLAIFTFSFLMAFSHGVEAAPAPPEKVAPRLWAEGGRQGFIIILSEQADLSDAYSIPDLGARRRLVYARLLATAQRTQAPLLRKLWAQGVRVRRFYVVNAIYVEEGTPALLKALAARSDVARLIANPSISIKAPSPRGLAPQEITAVEPNIAQIGAPQVWAMGYRGQGIVIGGQDTGYAWEHSALKEHYRGWEGSQATHDYNWHDAIHTANDDCPADSPEPCDDYGHGTHTMGIAVGDDGGTNQIGVAPEARWIGCRNMDDGVGTPARYLECFEFFLAPYPIGGTPTDGKPELAPDVTVNSWTCPPDEGCDVNTLQAAVEAERAAGIFTVAAAGNSGSDCSTISDPPALYADVFTIGAVSSNDTLAFFSSRGPVTRDDSGRRKPDLTAPGVSIRSAYPPNSYAAMSGTSMATPHVAGATALLWSAAPYLRAHLTATTYVLTATAIPISSTECSSDGVPNNLYGWGRLDVHHAVTMALASRGIITGLLRDAETGDPLAGRLVLARSQSIGEIWSAESSAEGRFTLTVLAAPYLLISPCGEVSLTVSAGMTETVLFECHSSPSWRLWLPLILRDG